MKKALILAACLTALMGTTACVDYGYGRPGYGYASDYDVYYDGYYGPVRQGYWGHDGWFYYRDPGRRDYRRDDGRHFRREPYNGYRSYRIHHGHR
ncbi:hypothetical protein [Asticcacaulis sp. EMRT-3]|uniref:hypothetical protein n=1 Tax=Asticcacaulis sp. EMRT-3 TaxID=3040349 RepID=UPI0024AF15BE|nr:hypothetical protein [Asticcacaulis sp. EMRT-3]MDI7775394.1 hypothetical protein [Asticcacaulis sp. EMRT-3]